MLGLAAETGKKYSRLYRLEGGEIDLEKRQIVMTKDASPISLSNRTVEDVRALLAICPSRPFANVEPSDLSWRLRQLAQDARVEGIKRIQQCVQFSHDIHNLYLAQHETGAPEPEMDDPSCHFDEVTGEAYVIINGVKHSLGARNSTASRDGYARIIAEWKASGKSPTFGWEVKNLTVAELVAEYEVFATDYFGLGVTSEVHRIALATKFLVRFYGRTLAAEFDHLKFKAVRQALIDNGNVRKSINAHMKRIVRLFKWAAGEGKIPPEVPQALSMIPGLRRGHTKAPETPPVQPADDAVVEATLPHLTPVVADMVRLQRLTGMRPGEICIMRLCDIDRTNSVWIYYPERHKTMNTGRERPIFIGPQGQALLAKYLDRGPESPCFQPQEAVAAQREQRSADRKTPLSCGNRRGTNLKRLPKKQAGERYEPKTYNRAVAYVLKRIFPEPEGLSEKELAAWRLKYRWSPNRLRHAAATEIRKRYGLEAAQVILGHAKCDTTQIYAQRDLERGVEVAMNLG